VRFVDTKVLLYAISRDPEEQDKAKRANEVLAARDLGLSVQVLQEFYVQATRESRSDPLKHEQAVELVESFMRFPVLPITSSWCSPPVRHVGASASRTGTPRSSKLAAPSVVMSSSRRT
jgi:predicted nucleic acid-binding protein